MAQKQPTETRVFLSNNFQKKELKVNKGKPTVSYTNKEITQKPSASVVTCQKIIESCNIFVDLAKECEEKNDIIEKQEIEIREMRNLDNISREKIKRLESEIILAKQRSENLTCTFEKYKSKIVKHLSFQTSIINQGKDITERFSLTDASPRSLVLEVGELRESIQLATLKLKSLREGLNAGRSFYLF